MKCAMITQKKMIETKDISEPILGTGKVIIEVKKAGICGSDIHYWDSGEPVGLVMGHELCGTVIDAGSRSDLRLGDRVTALPISPCGKCPACKSGNPQYCPETWNDAVGLSLSSPGAYALKTSLRPDLTIKVPEEMTDEEVAMVEPTAVSFHAVRLSGIKPGDNVLVIGAGIIGDICAMIAKKAGASFVAVSEVNEKRGEKAVTLGCADKFYNAKDETFMKEALENCPYGYDIVFDCCGNTPAVSSAVMLAKPNGTIVLVGVSLDSISFPSAVTVTREQKLYGAIGYTYDEFAECINLINKKKFNVSKFVDDIVPIEGVQKAFERLTSGEDDAIKILIDPAK